MRYFLELAYRGAPFHGWQVQPGVVTVQSTIEDALAKLVRRPVSIVGACKFFFYSIYRNFS